MSLSTPSCILIFFSASVKLCLCMCTFHLQIVSIWQPSLKEKKINHTKVGFKEFWYECVDWDMIKLFYAMMMLFFTMVGVFTFIYLLYCFNYNEKMWYYYFPGKQADLVQLF